MPVVRYRSYDHLLQPRRTRLVVPGWAGQSEPRADGSHEYPWHCVPFVEAARSGLELLFPYEDEVRVCVRSGEVVFEDGSGRVLRPDEGPPFRPFGAEYYTFRSNLDLKVDPAYAIKVETHPSFYTDRTGTVPVAVPAVLQAWWPMINFLVFKAPAEGASHAFRPGQPFVSLTVVSADLSLMVEPMPAEEAAERELQSRRLHASRATLGADSRWTSATDTIFDGTYRRLFGAARHAAGGRPRIKTRSDGDDDGGGGGVGCTAATATAAARTGDDGGGGGGGGGGGEVGRTAAGSNTGPAQPSE